MPIGNYNVGSDVSININLPNGPVTFSNVTDFDAKQMTSRQESHGIDGINRFQEIPKGWDGSISIDRADSNVDEAFAYLEGLYYSGKNVPNSTITQTITEVDGSVTQWRFTGVQFALGDGGSFKGDAKVTQRVNWVASQRIQVQ